MNKTKSPKQAVIRLIGRQMQSGKSFEQALNDLSGYPVKQDAAQLERLRQSFNKTQSVQETIKLHPEIFSDDLSILLDRTDGSAASGRVLTAYYRYQGKITEMFSAIRRATNANVAYFWFVLAVMVVLVTMLNIFVLPVFEDLYAGFGMALPALTAFVMDTSDVLATWWPVLLAILAIGYWLVHSRVLVILKTADISTLKPWMLYVPMAGSSLRYLAIAKSVNMLNILIANGVKPMDAMSIIVPYARQKGVDVGRWLDEVMGASYGDVLKYYDEMGMLQEDIDEITEETYAVFTTRLLARSRINGIMALAVLALIVGIMVIAMYLPIFSLGSITG